MTKGEELMGLAARVEAGERSVSIGAQILKRADVMHVVHRAARHATAARALALEEGREGDAEVQAIRLRAIQTVLTDLQLRAPVFINAAPARALAASESGA